MSMDKYMVSSCDDYGRAMSPIKIVIASSETEARIKVGMHLKNSEIYKTGFYCAKKISDKDISTTIAQLRKMIDFYKNILE